MRIGLLHSARMTPRIPDPVPVTEDSPESVRPWLEGRVWSGSQGRHWVVLVGIGLVGVGGACSSVTGRRPDAWVLCSV